jgi:O-antigen/teichoic acid export membrane protein
MKTSKKIIQTALSYGVTTVVGFLGTIYFARTLGPDLIGTFSLGVSVVVWGSVFDLGIGISAVKRISEGNRQSRFLTSVLFLYFVITAAYCLGLILNRGLINRYAGADVAVLIIYLFVAKMAYMGLSVIIKGLNAVHIKNWIDLIEQLVRIGGQAILVTLGFSFIGLFAGYLVSIAFGVLCALYYISTRKYVSFDLPTRLEFQNLFSFAKYSWLSRVKSQTVSWMDVLVLGFFSTQGIVGVYQIAWTVSKTFDLLPKAISSNMFPEASKLAETDDDQIQALLEESLVYAGYIAIPGTIGAALLGRRILAIYGPEFQSGVPVLLVLSVAVFIRSYEQQFITVIDSIDRPDITFRINIVFVANSIALNIILIWKYGSIGAATATLMSTMVSFSLAWYYTSQIVDVRIPFSEVGKQILAAILMGFVVVGLNRSSLFIGLFELIILVGTGAMVYLAATVVISKTVRMKSRALIAELPVGNNL